LLNRLLLLITITALLAACGTNTGSRLKPESDLYRSQVIPITVVKRFIYTPEIKRALSLTPITLRPTNDDFLTIESDINDDGRMDIITIIQHYHFAEGGMYNIYILLKTEHDYQLLPKLSHTHSLDLKILPSKTNGFHDIQSSLYVMKFNGEFYE
jgi:hypothetical protein